MSRDAEDLVREFGLDTVVAALAPLLSDDRKNRIETVLDQRLTSVTVVLENLHDPRNGAAAIRSVEAIGLSAIHVIESAETFSASVPVTIGADKWLDIHRYKSVAGCANALREAGMMLCALCPGAETTIDDVAVDRPIALFAGNEHAGLSDEAIAAADTTASIPIFGFSQSFNLSVSVALAASRIAERRRQSLGAAGDVPGELRARLRARWYALGVRNPRPIIARFVSNSTR